MSQHNRPTRRAVLKATLSVAAAATAPMSILSPSPSKGEGRGEGDRSLSKGEGRGEGDRSLSTSKGNQTPRDNDRTLVLLHLAGGNDGLNTIIPYATAAYYELRPQLSEAARGAIPIDGDVAFHASLRPLVPLFERGSLAIIQGVGYPDPDYSHIGSCRIWTAGQLQPATNRNGWDGVLEPSVPHPEGTGHPPCGVRSLQRPPTASERPRAIECKSIAATMSRVAQAIGSPNSPPIIRARMDGFDTHADQLPTHARLLRELAEALATFQAHIERQGLADRVMLLAWSEFGRRPAENAAAGTDHGTAGPVFVLGKQVRGGLHGQAPSLTHTDFGNLLHTVDFRQVYATAASRWLGCGTTATTANVRPLAFA